MVTVSSKKATALPSILFVKNIKGRMATPITGNINRSRIRTLAEIAPGVGLDTKVYQSYTGAEEYSNIYQRYKVNI